MPDTVNVHTELIRIETEQSSANQTQQTTQRIEQRLDEMRKSAREVGRAFGFTDDRLAKYGKSARKTGANIDDLSSALNRSQQELRQTAQEMDTVGRSQEELADQARRFGDVESRTRAITGAAGALGGAGFERTANIGAELLAVNEAAGLLRQELPELVAGLELTRGKVLALGIAGGALALLGLAISSFADDRKRDEEILEEARKKYQEYFELVLELNLFLVNASQEDLKNRLLAGEDAVEAAQQTEAEIQESTDAILADLLEIADALQIELRIAPDQVPDPDDLLAILEILEQMGVSAPEIRARLEALATTQDTIEQIYEETAEEAERLAEAIDPLTGKFGDLTRSFKQADEAFPTRGARTFSVIGDEPLRKQARPGFVDSLSGNVVEAAAQALIAVNEKVADSDAELVKAQEAAAKTTDKLAKLTDKFNLALKREAEDFALERTRDLADHYGELAEIDRDFYSEREDILADVSADLADINKDRIKEARTINRDLQRLAKDHRDRMFRIERDSRRDLLRAARRLDGIAAFDARQAKKDALEDENQQFVDEKDRREEDFQDRVRELDEQRSERQQAGMDALRDLEDQHRQERSAKVLDFRLRLAREDEDRAIRLSRLQQDHITQRNELLKNFANQIGLTNQHYGTMLAITQFGMQGVTGLILTEWLNLQSQLVPTQAQGAQGVGGGFRDFPGSVDVNVQGDGVIADMVKQVMVDVFERF